jgi:carboxyl-terminal processing protease
MLRKPDIAFWTFAAFAGAAGVITVLNASQSYSAGSRNSEIYGQLDLFGRVLERVRDDYVEKPDDAMLIESAINGMLASLDPHSSYLSAKAYRDMQVETRGAFGGLGMQVSMELGVVKVVSRMDGSPAAKTGIQANDVITHVDGEPIAGMTLAQAVDKMRGPVNTPVTVTIVRKSKPDPFDIKLVREVIHINPINSRLEGDVLYVKIAIFNELTHANLVKQVADLKTKAGKNLKGYVVDLRNDPGGLLDQAILVVDDFLEQGTIVVTKSRDPEEVLRAFAKPGDIADGKPIVVLINGGSASASEIVAGALQDHLRATIVGTRSFGKGSVQTVIPLGENGALRLTTARYYTPSGRSIQAKGIEPDVVVEQELPPELQAGVSRREIGEASLRGHLRQKDETGKEVKEESGSSWYVPTEADKDKQLQYALKLLRGTQAAPARPKRSAQQ